MTRLADQCASDVAARPHAEQLLDITVLSGGPSAEREVSLKSGQAVASALKSQGHRIQCADISPDSLEALAIPADLVFVMLHGKFGEDGQVQRILEARGLRYTGSDATASSIVMDKVATKSRFIEAQVPTPRFDVVTRDRVDTVLRSWCPPAVIKPISEGSSIDCVIAHDRTILRSAVEQMTDRYGRCMIEQCIEGPELTVGILGDRALPPIQIRTKRDFYDYEAKYIDNDTEYLFDIDLPLAVLEEIQSLSLKAHQALGCRDFSRVDWMVDEVTHQPYALEVNTIPGFTDHSLLPKAAQRAGIAFGQLCQRIVDMTLSR